MTGIWGGLIEQTLGGAASSFGDVISDKFAKLFGGKSQAEAAQAAQEQAVKLGIGNNRANMLSTMYNEAGQQGAQVGASYKTNLDSLGQSADAVRKANSTMSAGQTGITNANTQAIASMQMGQNNMGNMRRDMVDMGGNIGSPAAIAAMAGQLGQGATNANTASLGQAGQIYNQANQTGISATGQANNMLQGDLALRRDTYVRPYGAQQGQSMVPSTLGGLGSTQNSVDYDSTNLLAGFANWAGNEGGHMQKKDHIFDFFGNQNAANTA